MIKQDFDAIGGRLPVTLATVSMLALMLSAGVVRAAEVIDAVVTVPGTQASPWVINDQLQIGGESGFLQILDGSVTSDGALVGFSNVDGAVGLVSVEGENSSWTSGNLVLGLNVPGGLAIEGGGTVNSGNTTIGGIFLGVLPALGTAEVLDGTWNVNGEIKISNGGFGSLDIDGDASTVTSGNGFIGYSGSDGGEATTLVTSGGSWDIDGDLTIGFTHAGSLEMSERGTIRATNTILGDRSGGVGEFYFAGREGHRAVLETGRLEKGFGSADVTLAGGILRATRDEVDFLSGFDPGDVTISVGGTILRNNSYYVDTGGAYFDTNGFDIGVAAPLDGDGWLVKQGAGTLTLSGANAYSGGTIVEEGILSIAADENLGAAAGDLTLDGGTLQTTADLTTSRATTLGAGGGTFLTDDGTTLTHDGVITGTGALTKNGAGTLVLSGANDYSGGTSIEEGVLSIEADGNLGGALADLTIDGGTLQTTADLTTIRATTLGAGGGTFLTDSGTTLTHDGVITGTGALTKSGAGTLALSGLNDYSGGTTVDGGTLRIAADYSLGDAAGDLTLDGGTLQTTASLNPGRAITLGAGGGTFLTENATTLLQNGTISGTGMFTKAGAGTLVFTGANAHSGGTHIEGGTLVVATDAALGDAAGDLGLDGGSLRTSATMTTSRATTLGVGGGTFLVDGGTTLTHDGAITGTGALTKGTAGTLVLSGANDYSGGTALEGGTLRIAADENLGAAAGGLTLDGGTLHTTANLTTSRATTLGAGDGTFLTDDGTTLSHNGAITGTGTLTKDGAGTLRLTRSNTYSGGTTVRNGTLAVDGRGISHGGADILVGEQAGDNGALTIINGGAVTSDFGALGADAGSVGAVTVAGARSVWATARFILVGDQGTGTLTIAEGGTVDIADLGSSNSVILLGNAVGASGTLNIGNGGAAGVLTAGVVDSGAGTGTLNFNHSDASYVFSRDGTAGGIAIRIRGSAAVNHIGTGTTTLTGNYTYTGGTTIEAGTLHLASGGSIAGNAAVNGGHFDVDGGIAGLVTVGADGTLSGSGILGGLQVNSGGRVTPGNSIGTMNVAGDYTLGSGATYEVELRQGGNTPGVDNDLIAVAGAATLEEGSLILVTPENGTDDGANGYGDGTTYTILTTGSGLTVNGAGPDISDDYAYLDFAGGFDADNYYLTASLVPNVTSFCLSGQSGNQCATGDGVFALGAGNSVYDAVLNLSEAQAAAALNQLSGESHAAVQSALLTSADLLRDNLLGRMRTAGDEAARAVAVDRSVEGSDDPLWLRILGGTSALDGNGNVADLDSEEVGFLAGADSNPDWLGRDWRLGFAAGYTATDYSVDERLASGDSENLHLGLYSGRQWGSLALRLGAAQSWHWIDTERNALGRELTGDTRGRTFQAFGELGYGFSTGSTRIEPFANAAYVQQRIEGFNESGGAAALSMEDASNDHGFTTLGVRGSTLLSLDERALALHGSLGWRHALGNVTPESTHAFAGGTAFTVTGTPIDRNVAMVGVGLDLSIAHAATLGFGYDGEFGDDSRRHTGRVNLRWSF
jgi:outer membrane autotransporter protein